MCEEQATAAFPQAASAGGEGSVGVGREGAGTQPYGHLPATQAAASASPPSTELALSTRRAATAPSCLPGCHVGHPEGSTVLPGWPVGPLSPVTAAR